MRVSLTETGARWARKLAEEREIASAIHSSQSSVSASDNGTQNSFSAGYGFSQSSASAAAGSSQASYTSAAYNSQNSYTGAARSSQASYAGNAYTSQKSYTGAAGSSQASYNGAAYNSQISQARNTGSEARYTDAASSSKASYTGAAYSSQISQSGAERFQKSRSSNGPATTSATSAAFSSASWLDDLSMGSQNWPQEDHPVAADVGNDDLGDCEGDRPLAYCYITDTGQESGSQNDAEIGFDDDDEVAYLVKCRKKGNLQPGAQPFVQSEHCLVSQAKLSKISSVRIMSTADLITEF